MIRHPFPVVAHFDWALSVTFAAPRQSLVPLLAPGLELDLAGETGFLAVACVQTRRLRPAALPRLLGMDFFLAGYRLFVRFASPSQGDLRGLQILGSETDRRPMVAGGRLFTHYGYRHASVSVRREEGRIAVSTSSGLAIEVREEDPALPAESPFAPWDEARRFAGPMPYTFAAEGGRVVRVRGERTHWKPRPVRVVTAAVPFLETLTGNAARPAAAFLVEDVDYRWSRGVRERSASKTAC